MSEILQNAGGDALGSGEAATLVQRFWLNFIRSIAKPHLTEESGIDGRDLLEGRLAENVDKAVAAALAGRPPHRCGSFGRAALSVMRSREKPDDDPVRFPDGAGSPGSSNF